MSPGSVDTPKAYLVGGGIASMAAAAFLIRDGDMIGNNITILEEMETPGGSLDASGSPKDGYSMRGGRMLESKYLCTFDLFASIPTLDDSQTVTDEIFQWNRTMKTSSKSRLFRQGERQIAPLLGLHEQHILTIERLVLEPEALLGRTTIADQFDASFFTTDFWFMWCTTFAFQAWHSAVEFKRYLNRFAHMIDGFDRLSGIMRTTYNQYDSLVRPLHKWLNERGVRFEFATRVTNLQLQDDGTERRVSAIELERGGMARRIVVAAQDLVLVTLGSMTDGATFGTMESAAEPSPTEGSAWALWKALAIGRPEFGHPAVFTSSVEKSQWVSFTTTLYEPTFLRLVRDKTGNVPGEGGLITFPKSSWLASIVIPYQPHFMSQPDNVDVFWGYGLAVDTPGDHVRKPMSECSGREIMIEILGHLRIKDEAANILGSATCIPCMMPFITAQFMPRAAGDRPAVRPAGWQNLAFTGQFCEVPDDVVFTVEYSIRSAQLAVYSLLGLHRAPPPMYQGKFDPRVLFKAFLALHDLHRSPIHA